MSEVCGQPAHDLRTLRVARVVMVRWVAPKAAACVHSQGLTAKLDTMSATLTGKRAQQACAAQHVAATRKPIIDAHDRVLVLKRHVVRVCSPTPPSLLLAYLRECRHRSSLQVLRM